MHNWKARGAGTSRRSLRLLSANDRWAVLGGCAFALLLACTALRSEAPAPEPVASASLKLNLNAADELALMALPGIGPVLAQRLLAYRRAHGPFASWADLEAVEGIGPYLIEKLKPFLTFGH